MIAAVCSTQKDEDRSPKNPMFSVELRQTSTSFLFWIPLVFVYLLLPISSPFGTQTRSIASLYFYRMGSKNISLNAAHCT